MEFSPDHLNMIFLNPFIHERATSLAISLLCQLVQELRHRPCPLILAAFSGGSKACMYNFFQIIEGRCEAQLDLEDSRLVSSCIAGHIYDSCPVDFSYDLGARFALPPTILKMPGSGKLVSLLARGVTSSLDALFLTSFGPQRSEYFQTLCSSVNLGAPFLILCSESDDLAPCSIICNFARSLQDLGGNVKLVKWNDSPHVGHFRSDPCEYIAAVAELLELSASVFAFKIKKFEETTGMQYETDKMSKLICDLQNAASDSNQSLRRVALGPNDHFFVSSSVDYQKDESNILPDDRKERPPWPNSEISANSVLGQVLFDACVPKNVEGWDIRFSGSLNGQPFASARKYSGFNAIKRIRRSRL
ncbi:hypothetical protein Leryth_019005 [Lithospermum erythrorhizon]|nr:hypothetical protein Leryth_019005 [Lithospermum erythrorhizon]